MVDIRVDVSLNRIERDGHAVCGTRRWEALALACLLDAGEFGLTQAALQAQLQRAGQASPLDRTGVLRLLRAMEAMVDAVLGPNAFLHRIRFTPRHRTVGPWALLPPEGENWQVVGDADGALAGGQVPARLDTVSSIGASRRSRLHPQPRLVEGDDPEATFRTLELIFRADACTVSGQLREAADLLLAASALQNLTDEGLGLIELRRARLLNRSGRFDEALDLARHVARRAGHRGFRDPGQRGLALQLARRTRYDRTPHDYECLGADPFFETLSAVPDLRGLGEAESLAALISRRRSLSAAKAGETGEAVRLLQVAWQHLGAAMYWATSSRRHEDAASFVFNMGRVQSALHDLGESGAVAACLRAYQIGLLIRDNFFVGNDSVWGHIWIGSFWLDHPDRRHESEAVLGFARHKLSDAAFYLDAWDRAKLVGEPRQMALCSVNLWRFGAAGGGAARPSAAIQRMARERLLEVLRGRRDLKDTLSREVPQALEEMLAR